MYFLYRLYFIYVIIQRHADLTYSNLLHTTTATQLSPCLVYFSFPLHLYCLWSVLHSLLSFIASLNHLSFTLSSPILTWKHMLSFPLQLFFLSNVFSSPVFFSLLIFPYYILSKDLFHVLSIKIRLGLMSLNICLRLLFTLFVRSLKPPQILSL